MLNGHTLAGWWWTDIGILRLLLLFTFCSRVRSTLGVFSIGLLLQETTLLSRSRTWETNRSRMTTNTASGDLLSLIGGTTVVSSSSSGVVGTGRRSRQVRDVLRDGMLRANVGNTDI